MNFDCDVNSWLGRHKYRATITTLYILFCCKDLVWVDKRVELFDPISNSENGTFGHTLVLNRFEDSVHGDVVFEREALLYLAENIPFQDLQLCPRDSQWNKLE